LGRRQADEIAGLRLSEQGRAARLIFLDWLRIFVLLILLPYHVGMVYVTWPFHVKSPVTSHAPEIFMLLSSPWRMSVLFLVSGAVTWLYLGKVPTQFALRDRTRRLLAPLLCGVLLLVPPQSYVEVMQKYGYSGSFTQFLGVYFSGSKQFCTLGKCLILPTWNHLWFLPYLWVYTLLLVLVFKLLAGRQSAARTELGSAGRVLVWWLAPLFLLLLGRAALAGRFPQSYDLVTDWFSHSQYLFMYFFGAALAARPHVWPIIGRLAWASLGLTLVAWSALLLTRSTWWLSMQQWFGVLAAVGLAYRYANRDHPWRQWLSGAVFPVYVLHQTWIVLLVWWLRPLVISPIIEAPLVIALTLVLSVVSYRCLARIRWLRTWFGIGNRESTGGV
jgi:glucans biosynthesis protein C